MICKFKLIYSIEPEQWGHLYPNCNGQKQSPINIDREKVVAHNRESYPKFHFVNYDRIIPTFLTYNGHTCESYNSFLGVLILNADLYYRCAQHVR